jgi:PAS domain S-box-containing protein
MPWDELFRRLPSGVWISDEKDLTFLVVNPAFAAMHGWAAEDLVGRNAAMIIPESRRHRLALIRREMDARGHLQVEMVHQRRDGTEFPVEICLARVVHEGRSLVIGSVNDLSACHEVEDALRQREVRLRAIDEVSDEGILVSRDGTILEANAAFARLFGYASSEEAVGDTAADVVIPEDVETVLRNIRADERTPYRVTGMRRDGSHFDLEFRGVTASWQGAPARITAARDVTAQVALERQLRQAQKLEAIGQLAGGVAHDFNNLLGGILGYASLLHDRLHGEIGARDTVRKILVAAERAADLTRQLLTYSRQGDYDPRPVGVHATIDEVVGLLGHTTDRRITIRRETEAERDVVHGDPGQLHQALLNLAINACDAMPEGGTLTFRTSLAEPPPEAREPFPEVLAPASDAGGSASPADGPWVRIEVIDTGTGIPSDLLDRIFEPFFTTKATGKGTGLGLASTYGGVRRLGGTIDVTSDVGTGTRFTIHLPLAARGAPETSAAPEGPPPTGTGHILVVDDEPAIREVAAEMLEELGYRVELATDGETALATYRARAGGFDLVLLDHNMPRMSGSDCYRALRAHDPEVRCLLSTGFADGEATRQLREEGILGVLQKPFGLAALARAVESGLAPRPAPAGGRRE